MPAAHGTYSRYNHQRCRCDECRAANREYHRKFDRKAGKTALRHGSLDAHRRGCRCDLCCAAKKAADAAYYVANRDSVRARNREWNSNNREYVRELKAAKYAANRALEQQKRRNAYHADPGPYKDRAMNRRRKVAVVTVELIERALVWERDRGACHICGGAADVDDWHLDHIRALALGGEHSYANVAVSHPRCNREKWNKPWPAPL